MANKNVTYRDLVAKSDPDAIDSSHAGGVKGCPSHYGFKDHPGCEEGVDCKICWSRTVPEDVLANIARRENMDKACCETSNFDTNKMKEKMLEFVKRNGERQSVFVVEEMAELQKELMKHERGYDNRNEIVEECADVLLTTMTLLMVYGVTEDEVREIMMKKLFRARDFLPNV